MKLCQLRYYDSQIYSGREIGSLRRPTTELGSPNRSSYHLVLTSQIPAVSAIQSMLETLFQERDIPPLLIWQYSPHPRHP